jgi:hypothetical protein
MMWSRKRISKNKIITIAKKIRLPKKEEREE